jgi:hypothetical protein
MQMPGSSTFRPASTRSGPVSSSTAALSLRALRSQAAFVRSLLDEVERLAPSSSVGEALSEQIVEELAQLGSRSLQAAAELRQLVAPTVKCA